MMGILARFDPIMLFLKAYVYDYVRTRCARPLPVRAPAASRPSAPREGGSRGPEGSVVLTGGFTTLTDLTGGPGSGSVLTDLTGGPRAGSVLT